MLILDYSIFRNSCVVPNFSDGMLYYATVSIYSLFVSMNEFMEKNKDDDDDDDIGLTPMEIQWHLTATIFNTEAAEGG